MTEARPASEKQIAFLKNLATDQDLGMPTEAAEAMVLDWESSGILTVAMASATIEAWLAKPKRKSAQAKPGYYYGDYGDFYVVVENRTKTNTYAKMLVNTNADVPGAKAHWKWAYAKGMGRAMAKFEPLTAEKAAEFGHAHGVCLKCLRPLTDLQSVARGYGPVCAKKMGF